MKKIIIALFLVFMTFGNIFAETAQQSPTRYKDIETHDYDFQVKIMSDRTAKLTWNSYLQNRGFKHYKVLYSNKFANPSYPEITASFASDDITTTNTSLKLTGEKNHFFRVCSITDEGYGVTGRYCSSTRKFVLEELTKQEEVITQQEEVNSKLTPELQAKIDSRLELFLSRLQDKYDDAKIIIILDDIIARLDAYLDRPEYADMVVYMQGKLENYKTEYLNKLDVFESIFETYE